MPFVVETSLVMKISESRRLVMLLSVISYFSAFCFRRKRDERILQAFSVDQDSFHDFTDKLNELYSCFDRKVHALNELSVFKDVYDFICNEIFHT